MKKQGQLGWREFYVLAFFRTFPYLTRTQAVDLLFGGIGHSQASYAVKNLNGLVKAELLDKVWLGLTDWGYSITKKGQTEIEGALAENWISLKRKNTKAPFKFSRFEELKFKVLNPKIIAQSFPKDHTNMAAIFLSYYSNLVFLDFLHHGSKSKLQIISNPDFILPKINFRFAFEVENTPSSKSRKYSKLKSLFRDEKRFDFFVFIFKNKEDIKKYQTSSGWPSFCGAKYIPIGKKIEEFHLPLPVLSFASQRILFAVMPGEKINQGESLKILDLEVATGHKIWYHGTQKILPNEYHPLRIWEKASRTPQNL